MKMKRIALGITTTTFLSLGVFAGSTQTANAAAWHQGTPTILRGKWRTKLLHEKGYPSVKGRGYIKFKTNSFFWIPALPPKDGQSGLQARYKRIAKGVYYLKGRDYNNAPAGGIVFNYKVHLYNRHKMAFKVVNSSWDNHIFYKY
ncbi:MAG: hypothetical protein ABF664_11370 [Liquorilactobacillus satsumensis]